MNKAEKIEFVERFTGQIGSAPLIVVTEYRAVKVADSNSLRRRLEAKGLKLEVVKNTGSIRAKSFSARIRSINTEPTIPRQPTKPTRMIVILKSLQTVNGFKFKAVTAPPPLRRPSPGRPPESSPTP